MPRWATSESKPESHGSKNDVTQCEICPLLLSVHNTSLLCFCRNSISWCVNVVIEMDFTLCGGFSPRLWVEEVYVSIRTREAGCNPMLFMWYEQANKTPTTDALIHFLPRVYVGERPETWKLSSNLNIWQSICMQTSWGENVLLLYCF